MNIFNRRDNILENKLFINEENNFHRNQTAVSDSCCADEFLGNVSCETSDLISWKLKFLEIDFTLDGMDKA